MGGASACSKRCSAFDRHGAAQAAGAAADAAAAGGAACCRHGAVQDGDDAAGTVPATADAGTASRTGRVERAAGHRKGTSGRVVSAANAGAVGTALCGHGTAVDRHGAAVFSFAAADAGAAVFTFCCNGSSCDGNVSAASAADTGCVRSADSGHCTLCSVQLDDDSSFVAAGRTDTASIAAAGCVYLAAVDTDGPGTAAVFTADPGCFCCAAAAGRKFPLLLFLPVDGQLAPFRDGDPFWDGKLCIIAEDHLHIPLYPDPVRDGDTSICHIPAVGQDRRRFG